MKKKKKKKKKAYQEEDEIKLQKTFLVSYSIFSFNCCFVSFGIFL